MSKELKRFINENRAEFDGDLPPGSSWEHVERSIGSKKPPKQIPVRNIYKWSAAAAVFFIIAICFYFLVIREKSSKQELAKENIPSSNDRVNGDIGRMDPGFAAEAKKIYESIETQQKQLKAVASDQPELYSQFSQDLATLDSSYRVLKTQAFQTPNREVIIRAMMQNLQLQAELLAKQLQILNEFKNDKTQHNEKNNSPRI